MPEELHETYSVPGSGVPIFQAAAANLNPWTEAKVDIDNPDRGPLLIVVGDQDHTVPPAIASASYSSTRTTRASPSTSRSPAAATR